MFYAVTDLLTIATIWTWVESLQFNPFMPTQPNPTHGWTQPTSMSETAQISLSLPVPHWVRDAGHFKGFFTGGEKRLKGQDVRVTGGIAFGRDSDQR